MAGVWKKALIKPENQNVQCLIKIRNGGLDYQHVCEHCWFADGYRETGPLGQTSDVAAALWTDRLYSVCSL